MTIELETDTGATVRIYRFRDFLGAGSAANIITRFDHLLEEDEREGWRPNGATDEPYEYPPVAMSTEDWFDHEGNPA